MKRLAFFFLLALCAPPLPASEDFLRGSVVKSDVWKMDRVKDLEVFDGNVSFRNPRYTLKADNALYARPAQAWTMTGSVYMLRRFDDKTQVEVNCDKAYYLETLEEATLRRGSLPVRMTYTGQDGRVLKGLSDNALAENQKGLMTFTGSFALSTENLDMHSEKGIYDNAEATFLMYESTPVAVGTRTGYDFAISAEKIKFFKDTRDIKFYNRIAGWVKDSPDEDQAP
jgi:lipopolysaccharide export system protein LptA